MVYIFNKKIKKITGKAYKMTSNYKNIRNLPLVMIKYSGIERTEKGD
jgi:hypothetical protein